MRFRRIVILSLLAFVPCGLLAQSPDTWSKPFPPFRIAGNLYYVGSYELASYLITTSKGHILINSGLAGSAHLIHANLDSLGFKFSDIKILLATHGHFDHVGGMAEIKRLTGAQLMIQESDVQVLEDGGKSDYVGGNLIKAFDPVKVDQALKDQVTITLGETMLILHHHPGHTKGASSFTTTVSDEKRSYRVLIVNMPSILEGVRLLGMPTYANVGKDYARTFQALKDTSFDIWLSSHASQFGLHDKYNPGDPYKPERFIDPEGYRRAIHDYEAKFDEQLEKERKGILK